MATVRISDAVIPEVYNSYESDASPEKSTFFESGIVVQTPQLNNTFNDPALMATTPFWKDIDQTIEPNYGSDDPDVSITPNKIGSGSFAIRKAFLNQSFQAADLVTELAGSNPMQHIKNRFGTYWTRQWQRRAIATAVGILNANVAQDSGDMVKNVAIADGNAATSANLFNRASFIDACFTMGDRGEEIMAIAVHSVVYKRMLNNEDIDFIPDSKGTLSIPTYLGRRVIVDDMMPVVAGGTSGFIYTSILFGRAAFGYGTAKPAVPMAIVRDEKAANGAGVEMIIERNNWIIHPFGFSWTETTVAAPAISPTNANLSLAANWDRKTDRKNIPLAFLKTNG